MASEEEGKANEEANGSRKELRQDPLVERMRPDPNTRSRPDAQVLVGFLGKSVREGYWRVYLTPDLDEYLEIAEDDIIDSQPLSEDQSRSGTMVWVRRGAQVDYTISGPLEAQGEFLQGGLTRDFMPMGGFEGLVPGEMRLRTLTPVSRRFCTRRTLCTGACCPDTIWSFCGPCW